MTNQPICPNDELRRLRELIDDALAKEHLGQRTYNRIGIVLDRLVAAQEQGRVLPDSSEEAWNAREVEEVAEARQRSYARREAAKRC